MLLIKFRTGYLVDLCCDAFVFCMQLFVHKVLSVLSVDQTRWKVVWSFAITMLGELFVMMPLEPMTQMWLADNLDSRAQVLERERGREQHGRDRDGGGEIVKEREIREGDRRERDRRERER